MKTKWLFLLWTVTCAGMAGYLLFTSPDGACGQKIIYDETADGARQISAALAQTRQEHKLVLLQFGANWCGWCQRIHCFFNSDKPVSTELASHYLVVLVDVNNGHNASVVEHYGYPTALGLPVIVLLSADGRRLVTQGTGEWVNLDVGNYDSAKNLAFLKTWLKTIEAH